MLVAVVKILIGLFVWMELPRLIYNKRKYQKNSPQFFVHIACKIIGTAVIIFAIITLIRIILSLKSLICCKIVQTFTFFHNCVYSFLVSRSIVNIRLITLPFGV